MKHIMIFLSALTLDECEQAIAGGVEIEPLPFTPLELTNTIGVRFRGIAQVIQITLARNLMGSPLAKQAFDSCILEQIDVAEWNIELLAYFVDTHKVSTRVQSMSNFVIVDGAQVLKLLSSMWYFCEHIGVINEIDHFLIDHNVMPTP
jgi:hypothetical protein